MGGEFTSVTVEKDEALPYLRFLSARASDLTEVNARVLEAGLEDSRETLISGGSGWASHAPATAMIDRALGRKRQGMLRERGRLLGSLSRGGSGNVFEARPDGGEAGSSVPHAKFVEGGTNVTFFFLQFVHTGKREWGGGGIPGRPFAGWREERAPEYDRWYLDYVAGQN